MSDYESNSVNPAISEINAVWGIRDHDELGYGACIMPQDGRGLTCPLVYEANGQLLPVPDDVRKEIELRKQFDSNELFCSFAFDVSVLNAWLTDVLYGPYDNLGYTIESMYSKVINDYPLYNPIPVTDDTSKIVESIYTTLFSELTHRFISLGIYCKINVYQLINNTLVVKVPVVKTYFPHLKLQG